jgi:hypothetical protein
LRRPAPLPARLAFVLCLVGTTLLAQTTRPPENAPVASQAAATPAPPAPGAHILPPPPDHRFPVGQSLQYSVDWRVFGAGTATIRLESAGRDLRILASADSRGAVSLLYHVHDTLDSRFDPATFCSRSITKHTEEGRRRLETEIVFDPARRKSVLSEKNLRDGSSKRQENDIPPCVTDVLSSLFYVAALPLTGSAVYTFPINDGGLTTVARVATEGRETITTPGGEFTAVRVKISAETGRLKDRGAIWVWFTDDAARTPVQIKSRLFWGNLTFRLVRVEPAAR